MKLNDALNLILSKKQKILLLNFINNQKKPKNQTTDYYTFLNAKKKLKACLVISNNKNLFEEIFFDNRYNKKKELKYMKGKDLFLDGTSISKLDTSEFSCVKQKSPF